MVIWKALCKRHLNKALCKRHLNPMIARNALLSGETLNETVMAAHGSLADPLSDADIEAKLRTCLRHGGADWDEEGIIDAVWRLDTLDDISSLMNAPRANHSTASTGAG